MLCTIALAVRAIIIVMPLFSGGRQSTTADITTHETAMSKELFFWSAFVTTGNNILHSIKNFLCDKWLMFAGIIDTFFHHHAIIKRAAKNNVNLCFANLIAALCTHTFFVHHF
ncbi:MAG: hypothetical protein NTW66_04495 [Candidatus Magasanikbacteria bacterium]|nr:hypothetical protein [Candidatus Magasanikbacteria bacterium]